MSKNRKTPKTERSSLWISDSNQATSPIFTASLDHFICLFFYYSVRQKSERLVWKTEQNLVWLSDVQILDNRAVRFVWSFGMRILALSLTVSAMSDYIIFWLFIYKTVKTGIRFILVWFETFKVDKPNVRNPNNFVRISDVVQIQTIWQPNECP